MTIAILKFHHKIFLLISLNLLLYTHGMQPKCQNKLSAAAKPFIPQSSRALIANDHLMEGREKFHENWEAIRRSAQMSLFQRGHQEYLDNLKAQDKHKGHLNSQQYLTEDNMDEVEEKIRKLPDDPFSMKTFPKSRKASKKKWRLRIEEKLRENRKEQKKNWMKGLVGDKELGKVMQGRSRQKKNNHESDLAPDTRHSPDRIAKEKTQSLEKDPNQMTKESAVTLGENESKDEIPSENSNVKDKSKDASSRNDRDHSEEGSEKLGNFEANTYQEKFTSSIVRNTYTQQSAQQSFSAAVTSKTTHENQVKEDVNSTNMTDISSTTETKAHRKQKKMMKQNEILSKEGSSPVVAPRIDEPGESGIKRNVSSPIRTAEKPDAKNSSSGSSTQQISTDGAKSEVLLTGMAPKLSQTPEENEIKEGGSAVQLKHADAAAMSVSNSFIKPDNPLSSSFESSGSKNKSVVTDEQKANEESNEYNEKVDLIVKMVQKLEHDKSECMVTKNKKKKKEAKITTLIDDYLKILSELEEYSALYNENQNNIVYFGDLFNQMNAKASAIDNEHLKRVMEETLDFLAKNNLLYLDDMFENIRRLMGFIEAYNILKTGEAKAEMIEWYESTVVDEIYHVFHYIFVNLLPDLILTRHAVYGGLFLFSEAMPNLHQEFLAARQTVEKYMDIAFGPEEKNPTMSKTELYIEQLRKDEKNNLSVNLLSASGASGSKEKAVMSESPGERIPGLNWQIDSLIDIVQKLEDDRVKCMKLVDDDEKKVKVSDLMKDYNTIMDKLEEFSEKYYRNINTIVYIGDLFDQMKRDHHKPSLINMMRMMQESLEYLDENLRNSDHDVMHIDQFLENTRNLKGYLVAYDEAAKTQGAENPVTKQAKAKMTEWYTNNVEGEFRHVLRYLHVGLHNEKLPVVMVYYGIKKLLIALPSRKKNMTRAIRTISNYYKNVIMQFGQFGDDKNNILEDILEDAEKMNKDIEFVVRKIEALEQAKQICTENVDMKQKKRLKIYYQIVMDLLNSFVKDFELKRRNTSDFFVDVIDWMLVDLYTGKEDVHADDLNSTMRSSLSLLQGNTPAEDMTNFTVLLHDIDRLKAKEETCEKLVKSLGGFRVPETRAALNEVHEFYIKEVEPNLRKTIGFLLIGMKNETGERLSRNTILSGLAGLSEMALPRYKQDFLDSFHKITLFNKFLCKSSVQEISENLTEYVAKILGIADFDPGTSDLDELTDKLEYPKIYEDGLKAINELKQQLTEEGQKSTIDNPIGSSGVDTKNGKETATRKTVETDKIFKFGPVDNSNWEEVLIEAKKLIRYMNILEKMIVAEIRPGKKVYGKTFYLRAWAILFRDKFVSILNKWEKEFCNIKNKKHDQRDGNAYCILRFYSEGISNLAVHHRKLDKVKRRMIRVALEELDKQMQTWAWGHRPENPEGVDEPW